jgi:hypothetical protein
LLANGDRWEPQLARNIEAQIRHFWYIKTFNPLFELYLLQIGF